MVGHLIAHADGSVDTSAVEGINADLILRPFHQKGAVVSLREFTNNATNHHHGMESVERFGVEMTGTADFDQDGVEDELSVGDRVNVERSARFGDEIGGHEVSGHVIGRGEIRSVHRDGHEVDVRIGVDRDWMRFILPKGFIAVDGSSLTIGKVGEDVFDVHLIPETLRLTKLGTKKVGEAVNIELDPKTVAIVQTVERVLAARGIAT